MVREVTKYHKIGVFPNLDPHQELYVSLNLQLQVIDQFINNEKTQNSSENTLETLGYLLRSNSENELSSRLSGKIVCPESTPYRR